MEGDVKEAPLLEAILWDMAQLEFINESGKLAAPVQETLVESLKGRDRGVRQAPLAVLAVGMIRFHAIQSEFRVYRWRGIWANSIYPIPLAGKSPLGARTGDWWTKIECRLPGSRHLNRHDEWV